MAAVFERVNHDNRRNRDAASFAHNSSVLRPPCRVVRKDNRRTNVNCNVAEPMVAHPHHCGMESTWVRNVQAYKVVYNVLALVGMNTVRVIYYPNRSFYVFGIYRR